MSEDSIQLTEKQVKAIEFGAMKFDNECRKWRRNNEKTHNNRK